MRVFFNSKEYDITAVLTDEQLVAWDRDVDQQWASASDRIDFYSSHSGFTHHVVFRETGYEFNGMYCPAYRWVNGSWVLPDYYVHPPRRSTSRSRSSASDSEA